MKKDRCKRLTRKGVPCCNSPMKNSNFCYVHSFFHFKKIPWWKNSTLHFLFTLAIAVVFFWIQFDIGATKEGQQEIIAKQEETKSKLNSLIRKQESHVLVVHPEKITFLRESKRAYSLFTVANNSMHKTFFNVEIEVLLTGIDWLFEKIDIKLNEPPDERFRVKVTDGFTPYMGVSIVSNIPNKNGEYTTRIRIAKLGFGETKTFLVTYRSDNPQITKSKGFLTLPLKLYAVPELAPPSALIKDGKILLMFPVDEGTARHMPNKELMYTRSQHNQYLKKAMEHYYAEEYDQAAAMFGRVFTEKPEHPHIAFNCGFCLYKSAKFEEALEVWMSVPETEEHKNLNFYRGDSLFWLQRYDEAIPYLEDFISILEPNDAAHLAARVRLVNAKTHNSAFQELAKESHKFCDTIDKEIMNLKEQLKKPSVKTVARSIPSVITTKQEAAFTIMMTLMERAGQERRLRESLDAGYRGARYLKGKSQELFTVDERAYLRFLKNLTSSLNNLPVELRKHSALSSLLEEIEKHNIRQGEQTIADMAMLIRAFYGDAKGLRSVKKGEYLLTYLCKVNDDKGLKYLYIESPSYLIGTKTVDLGSEKEYLYRECVRISTDVPISEKPFFRVGAENVSGKKSAQVDIYPFIEAIIH